MLPCPIFVSQFSASVSYDKHSATITDLFDDADDAFFRKILYNKQHVIHTYLPERSDIVYTLRTRQHNKNLIPKTIAILTIDIS